MKTFQADICLPDFSFFFYLGSSPPPIWQKMTGPPFRLTLAPFFGPEHVPPPPIQHRPTETENF